MSQPTTLLAEKVAVGHCVIIEGDTPCARLIAVIGEIQGDVKFLRYLSKRTGQKNTMPLKRVKLTPIQYFGVWVNLCKCGKAFYCQPDANLPPVAKYPDGKPYRWSDRQEPPERFGARRRTLYLAKRAPRKIPQGESTSRLEELTNKFLSHSHEGRVLMNHDDLIEFAALQHAELDRVEPVVAAAIELVSRCKHLSIGQPANMLLSKLAIELRMGES